jgi:hypothetical protein
MTRKQFLQYVGSALLFAVGAGSLVKALRQGAEKTGQSAAGYGASTYGGRSIQKN